MQCQLYAKLCRPFHEGSHLSGLGHRAEGCWCVWGQASMLSARVFDQGVGIGPVREGGGPAKLVQPVPSPCQFHPSSLGATTSCRPTGAKAGRPCEEGVRIAPSSVCPGCPD